MSAPGRDGSSGFDMNYEPEDPIDLTGEGLEQTPNIHLSYTATSSHRASDAGTADAPSSSSRAQRLPRFQRDIIDLAESDEEEQAQPQQQPQNRRIFGYPVDLNSLFPMRADLGRPDFDSQPSSNMDHNDVEFVSSRPLSRVSSRRPTPTRGSSRPDPAVRNTNNAGNTTIDLTADDDEDDDVIHTDTRALPSVNGDRPAMAGSGIGTRDPPALGPGLGRLVRHIRARGPGLPPYLFGHHPGGPEEALARVRAHQAETEQRLQRSRERAQTLQEHVDRHHANTARDRADPPPRPRPRGVNIINMDMDYGLVGFDLGFGVAPIRPPTPKYEPPPPVEKGFTRSPEEDEEVVCPNCGDELALGSGEVKQQVYVIKACGHVSSACPTCTFIIKLPC